MRNQDPDGIVVYGHGLTDCLDRFGLPVKTVAAEIAAIKSVLPIGKTDHRRRKPLIHAPADEVVQPFQIVGPAVYTAMEQAGFLRQDLRPVDLDHRIIIHIGKIEPGKAKLPFIDPSLEAILFFFHEGIPSPVFIFLATTAKLCPE